MREETLIHCLLPAFRKAGLALLAGGCNNSHSGNLSVREGEKVVITRTGAMLGDLAGDDLVVTSAHPSEEERQRASSELPVHLAIYERTDFAAIAHGHAIWGVLAGWLGDELRPLDVEGAYYFGRVPVVEHVPATACRELGLALAGSLLEKPAAILRGHGVFAAGPTLERAMQRITSVNDSARLVVEAHRLGLDVANLQSKPYLRFD